MLKVLYDYALRENLSLPAGYVKKTVAAYIVLTKEGKFLDIRRGGEEAVPSPDIGSLANGTDKSNVILEKRSVVIPKESSAKSLFFLNAMKDASLIAEDLKACVKALESEKTAESIRLRLDELKIKDSARITFIVDNKSILENNFVKDWWSKYREQFTTNKTVKSICLITGEKTVPVSTTTPINGLKFVGGHARGDALICFDKNAFCSYDLKKAANAPVSEEAFACVKAALDQLLHDAPELAGMKFVHWYDCMVPREADPIVVSGVFPIESVNDADDDSDENEEEIVHADYMEKSVAAKNNADNLIEAVTTGENIEINDDVNYYILLLSGVNGRVMIRRYMRGSFSELKRKLDSWKADLKLTNSRGNGDISDATIQTRMLKLIKYQKNDKNPFKRLGKELSGLAPAIINSILQGGQLPDTVASRALAFIRSSMMSADDSSFDNLFSINYHVWQWLKVWLIRSRGKEGLIMSEYNQNYASDAYQCGALIAIYEEIQRAAMPTVNASLIQRYYASAIQTPALVLGTLSKMSNYHLDKIENKRLAGILKEKLCEVNTHIIKPPVSTNLEQQSEFALGYYQMCAELTREKNERIEIAKQMKNLNKEGENK